MRNVGFAAVAMLGCRTVGPGTTERATALRGSRAAAAAVTQAAPGAMATVGTAGAVVALAALGASGAKASARKPRMVQAWSRFARPDAASDSADSDMLIRSRVNQWRPSSKTRWSTRHPTRRSRT